MCGPACGHRASRETRCRRNPMIDATIMNHSVSPPLNRTDSTLDSRSPKIQIWVNSVVRAGSNCLAPASDRVGERLQNHPHERQRETDQAGHHRNVEIAVVRVACAHAPGLAHGPIENKVAGAPERLKAEAGDRLLEHILDGKQPDLIPARVGGIGHQRRDQLAHRLDRNGPDRQKVGDDNRADDQHVL